MTILERFVFKRYFYKIDFSFFPVYINNVLGHIFLFILPCLAINYLLIFRKKKYKELLKKYPYYNGKLFIVYFVVSMMLPVLLLWLAILW